MQQSVLRTTLAAHEFQMRLACGIDPDTIIRNCHAESLDVADVLAQLELQILHDGPRRTDGGRLVTATVAIKRLHFEMLRQRMDRLIKEEQVTLANLRALRLAQRHDQLRLVIGIEELARHDARQLIRERIERLELRHLELASGVIHISKAVLLPLTIHRREVVRLVGIKITPVRDRARTDDLRKPALDELAGDLIANLLTDGHALAGLDEPGDVTLRRVMGHPAHGDAVALRERHIQDARRRLRILEEHLVEVPQPEQQDHIPRQIPPHGEILLHHGSGGGLGHRAASWTGLVRMPNAMTE